MPVYAYIILAVGWLLWMTPFLLRYIKRSTGRPATLDRGARWGMLFLAVAWALVWQGKFWMRSPGFLRMVISLLLFTAASVLSWTSTRALGRHWRLDAGLDS